MYGRLAPQEMRALLGMFRLLRGEVLWLMVTKFGQYRADLCTPLWDMRCSDKVEP